MDNADKIEYSEEYYGTDTAWYYLARDEYGQYDKYTVPYMLYNHFLIGNGGIYFSTLFK